jgi:hypothetical protein
MLSLQIGNETKMSLANTSQRKEIKIIYILPSWPCTNTHRHNAKPEQSFPLTGNATHTAIRLKLTNPTKALTIKMQSHNIDLHGLTTPTLALSSRAVYHQELRNGSNRRRRWEDGDNLRSARSKAREIVVNGECNCANPRRSLRNSPARNGLFSPTGSRVTLGARGPVPVISAIQIAITAPVSPCTATLCRARPRGPMFVD